MLFSPNCFQRVFWESIETVFDLRKTIFALRESVFALRESVFVLRETIFALRESVFVLRVFKQSLLWEKQSSLWEKQSSLWESFETVLRAIVNWELIGLVHYKLDLSLSWPSPKWFITEMVCTWFHKRLKQTPQTNARNKNASNERKNQSLKQTLESNAWNELKNQTQESNAKQSLSFFFSLFCNIRKGVKNWHSLAPGSLCMFSCFFCPVRHKTLVGDLFEAQTYVWSPNLYMMCPAVAPV